jgi:arylsulfatase A-like enzyme
VNVLLVVVDSLRMGALFRARAGGPRTPFLERLSRESVFLRRAYATECWTLPAHMSMFTGLLPSEHGAHFHTMAYTGRAPTLAELLAAAGHHTEVITRNTLFDGTIPGATRGFAVATRPLAPASRATTPLHLALALSKPRVRRLIRDSGFFHVLQKRDRSFVWKLARLGLPADDLALDLALARLRTLRRAHRPSFLFLNLYDVHAPYAPHPTSTFRRLDSWESVVENVLAGLALPKISSHAYLRENFRLAERSRRALLARYHRAIELMDAKLARFVGLLRDEGLLDDTLLAITSDHGEGFGEHGLYLHDASVYETHLHVPLWVVHPDVAPHVVDDVVSTRDLFGLLQAAGTRGAAAACRRTILDPGYRADHPVALAEHFHYPHGTHIQPRYRLNLRAGITARRKLIARGDDLEAYDLACDPGEERPESLSVGEFAEACRAEGIAGTPEALLATHFGRPLLRKAS